MVASIQPACLVYRVQMRPAFIHPRIDISGRLANLKASANRSRNHIRFNHARFNSVQQQTLPAAFVADIFGRYPLRLRKWPNSSLDISDPKVEQRLRRWFEREPKVDAAGRVHAKFRLTFKSKAAFAVGLLALDVKHVRINRPKRTMCYPVGMPTPTFGGLLDGSNAMLLDFIKVAGIRFYGSDAHANMLR